MFKRRSKIEATTAQTGLLKQKSSKQVVVPIIYDASVIEPLTKKRAALIGAVFAFCVAAIVAISQFVLIHKSLRLDESQSLWQSSHSLGGLLRVVAEDVHVPLYHLMLHFWILYFGSAVTTVRLMSLLFFLLTLPFVYLLARQVLRTKWALFATVLFSLSPFMNWYGNEGRMYTLLALFATMSQYFYIKLLQRKRAWFKFGLTSVFGVYSHYFFSFNLAVEGIYFLLNRKKFAPGSFKRFLFIGVLVVLSLGPWLIYFHSLGSGKNTSPHLVRPSSVDFFNVYSQFLFGFQDTHINTILVSLWPLIMLVAFFTVRHEQKASPLIGFIATMAFAPVVLAFLLSYVVSPFFLSRYLISSVAPLFILIVWLISYYGKRAAIVAAVGLLVILAPTSYQQAYSIDTPVLENYQPAADYINAHIHPQDTVILSTPFTVYPFEYYYHASAQINTLPIWDRQSFGAIPAFNAKTLPQQVNQLNVGHQYIYLLLSYNQGYEPTIKQYYLHHFQQVGTEHFSPDLNLYIFKVGYNNVPPLGTPKTQLSPTEAANDTPNYTIF
jgi:mannosyltransferase